MKLYLIILLPIMLSCGNSDEASDHAVMSAGGSCHANTAGYIDSKKTRMTSVWICNHPGTKQHNTLCIEEQYPEGCFIEGDNSKFCWLLTDGACAENRNHEAGWEGLCSIIGHND
jgi:hypothetical protein